MNTEQLSTFLKEVPLLSNLEDNELYDLAEVCNEKDFNKGQIIFYEEDMGVSLYIIASGNVKISILSNDGREHTLGLLKEKDFFGEISLLDGETRSTSAIALSKVKVITLSRANFIKLLRDNPDITYKIILALCRRIRWADRHVSNLAFLGAYGRVAKAILDLAEQNGVKRGNEIVINSKMTRQELANIAGTSRETLTRVIMEYQDEGLILANKNELIIFNAKKLEDKIL